MGWQAFGGCAVAWNGAVGGAAWAHDFALGAMARAAQVNNAAAELYSRKSWFFQIAETVSRQMMWLNLLWLLPLALWGRAAGHDVKLA